MRNEKLLKAAYHSKLSLDYAERALTATQNGMTKTAQCYMDMARQHNRTAYQLRRDSHRQLNPFFKGMF